jgi:hypothetical protein
MNEVSLRADYVHGLNPYFYRDVLQVKTGFVQGGYIIYIIQQRLQCICPIFNFVHFTCSFLLEVLL